MVTTFCSRALASRLQLYHSLASRLKSSGPALLHNLSESEPTTKKERGSMVTVGYVSGDPTGIILFMRFDTYSYDTPDLADLNYSLKHVLQNDQKPRIARSFLGQILLSGNTPNLATFHALVQSYCKQLTYQHVLDLVFTQMKAVGVQADDAFYKCMMEGVCTHFGPYVGFHLLKKMRLGPQIQVPLYCYDVAVGKLCKRKMIDEMSMKLVLINVLKHMKRLQAFPDDKIYNCLLKGRHHADIDFLHALGIGSQLFCQGIRIGAVIPTTAQQAQMYSPTKENWPKLPCKN